MQVFLRFANFYWQFIQGFSCIAAPFISILKTIGSNGSAANAKKTKDKINGNSMVGNNMVSGGEATN